MYKKIKFLLSHYISLQMLITIKLRGKISDYLNLIEIYMKYLNYRKKLNLRDRNLTLYERND